MKSDDFTNKIVAVYSRHLTDDDIKAAIQFYSTPAGQHMIAESGKAETEMIAVGQAEGAGALPEIFKELCDRYPELQAAGKICKELPLKESIILGNRILLTSSPNFARPE